MKDSRKNISQETVKNFIPSRYMGKWYELAKYPFVWETDCDGAVALYKWENNMVLVENQCYQGNEMVRARTAKAWIPDSKDPGKLMIKFDTQPSWPEPSPYWVHWTDYDNYAIVGGPSGQFLWLLSRKPTIKASEVEPLMKLIQSYGYDTDKLMANPNVVI